MIIPKRGNMPWTEEDFEKLKRRLIEERNKWRKERK